MKRQIILTVMALSFISFGAFADDAPVAKKDSGGKMMSISPETREKMAVAHEKMAACLRSDKPIKECHKEMHKDGCPMMGKGKMHHHGDEEAE